MNVKQVIVIRKDLQMRRGKEIAQGAHASLMFLRERLISGGDVQFPNGPRRQTLELLGTTQHSAMLTSEMKQWLLGTFAKITVRVNSEAELVAIADKAKDEDVECHLVQDAGLTEFDGVPTLTCLALGPDETSKIDRITGHLQPY